MDKTILKASKRTMLGRGVKKLRLTGVIPGNIYGQSVKSQSISVDAKELKEVYKKVGETGLVELQIDKETVPVLIHDIQIHPVSDGVLHVDFLQVNLKEKVTAQIPVEMVGESPAQKSGLGVVVLLLDEIEVEALPADLPEKFEIKAEELTEVDQTVKVSDLKYEKAKIEVKTGADEIVAKVEPPQKEEVVEAPVAAEETPVEGGETPAAPTEDQKSEESKAAAEESKA